MSSIVLPIPFSLGMRTIRGGQEQVAEVCLENGSAAEPVAIWKARKLISECSDEALPLTRVASFVQINPNYFCEKFKEVTGINYVKYLARIRVAKATDILRNSNRRISEIAFEVGFQSLSQFNRVFKKLSGSSPTAVRLAWSEDVSKQRTVMARKGPPPEKKAIDKHQQRRRGSRL